MPPNRILLDSNLWLDLASDPRLTPVLTAIDELVSDGDVELLVPQLVLDEFARHRDRVADQMRRSLSTHLKHVRDAVTQFVDHEARPKTLAHLDDLRLKIATKGSVTRQIIETVERLMATTPPILASDNVKVSAVERAIQHQAPFHRSKNSTVDALLVEIFAEAARTDTSDRAQHYFVTRNTRDFSQHDGDNRLPHADLACIFALENCHYSTSTAEVVRLIAPDLLAEFEHEFAYYPQPRELAELLDAERLLEKQVWYDRHRSLRSRVERGDVRVVRRDRNSEPSTYTPHVIVADIWEGALAAARTTEAELGPDRLGPWSDFEWGMLNGKLSALRWVLGDDWDMLDT